MQIKCGKRRTNSFVDTEDYFSSFFTPFLLFFFPERKVVDKTSLAQHQTKREPNQKRYVFPYKENVMEAGTLLTRSTTARMKGHHLHEQGNIHQPSVDSLVSLTNGSGKMTLTDVAWISW